MNVRSLLQEIDPYSLDEWTEAPEVVPNVQWSDVMLYWKGMPDGSNFLTSGWVHGL